MNKKEHSHFSLDEVREIYREYLAQKKMFFTRERSRILVAVMARKDHFSVDELMFDMQKEEQQVSRATLYRSLSQLADAGILDEVDFGHGHIHYEHVGKPHEHIVCRQCGKVFEVQSSRLEKAIHELANSKGFQVKSHQMRIDGDCIEFIKTGKCTKKQ